MKPQALLAEMLGTFLFFSVILSTVSSDKNECSSSFLAPIAIAVGLLAAIYFGGKISGGHFNPAVSIMMYVKGKLAGDITILYIAAQILGGLVALMINNIFI